MFLQFTSPINYTDPAEPESSVIRQAFVVLVGNKLMHVTCRERRHLDEYFLFTFIPINFDKYEVY